MIYHYLHDAGVVFGVWILTSIGMLVILGVISWVVVTILRHRSAQGGRPLGDCQRSESALNSHKFADGGSRTVIVRRAGPNAVHVPEVSGLTSVKRIVTG